MAPPAQQTPSDFLTNLRETTLREIAATKSHLQDIWSMPLHQRVSKGHSLGPLQVLRQDDSTLTLTHEADHSRESFSRLREGDLVRLTHNNPSANGPTATFISDDGDTILLELWQDGPLSLDTPHSGLTIDPDFFDPTDRFMAALDALQNTAHGRDVVLPILMGEAESQTDLETYDSALDELESLPPEKSFHASQQDAIALCLAASRFHLVQGPPGTGKTHVLAEVAARLIEKGHRVLLTGPTHRALEHALRSCRRRIATRVPVVKISKVQLDPDSPVPVFETFTDANLPSDAPYLVGSTPHNLWSNNSGLTSQFFDTILLDEASQLTLITATLALLRGEKFLFFGDHCQLPPVRLGPALDNAEDESIFSKLRKSTSSTMLTESWRLNRDLAEWPSATFYGNRLTSKHNRHLELSPPSSHPALKPRPGFSIISHDETSSSPRSPEEAETAAELILDLLRGGLSPSAIAVVTPFRAQAALIRRILRTRHEFSPWPTKDILADTVERLQGQERDVIIVSFAASRDAFILNLADFLFDPRRLNVAVTRARRKTILLHSRTLEKTAQSLANSGDHGAATFCSLLELS